MVTAVTCHGMHGQGVRCPLAYPSCCPAVPALQANWVTGMYPLAKFIQTTREAGVRVVSRMEASKSLTGPYSFKKVEMLVVPEDLHELARRLLNEDLKPTVSLLNSVCNELARARWWSWILMNPKIGDDVVHPTRRMCCSHCCCRTLEWGWNGIGFLNGI